MSIRCSAPRRDLVDRISLAVANNDPVTVEILLLALEEVADEPMLARLEAAMNRLGLPGQRRTR
ncbi:hypothetical protein [Streptomyces sp. TLI_171]|uniref:hypothetical protein n=1 Tax=Streptomyces sp. TLI_171 TaxID=1938859 RepID=UPI000C5B3724|nr:hypothetical protein [Streptomyces sp. TLI_171]RKE23496.1 hypothetical protein BX266_6968 [Streptomyces sp. TLI_171]